MPIFNYICSMEAKINWKLVVSFIIIIAGLFYITESDLMTIGIMLLLFVAYDFVLKKAKEEEERQKQQERLQEEERQKKEGES